MQAGKLEAAVMVAGETHSHRGHTLLTDESAPRAGDVGGNAGPRARPPGAGGSSDKRTRRAAAARRPCMERERPPARRDPGHGPT